MGVIIESSTVAANVAAFREAIARHAVENLGRPWQDLSPVGRFNAVALAVRDRMIAGALQTEERYREQKCKRLYYLSIEYLIGQSLGSNLRNLRLYDVCRDAVAGLGANLREIENSEPDAALGNGGLGRLAACFLDSLASLGMPGYGYGINYEYGLFRQEIDDGRQRELPDNWLAQGSPWQIPRPDEICLVPVYGHIEHAVDRHGIYNPMWMGWRVLVGLPWDMLIPGYGGRAVHALRLYSARASREFDMQIFNDGDYFRAVEQKIQSEMISKVLYPSDAVVASQELRLAQEYFLVACAVRDIVRTFQKEHSDFRELPDQVAIQLNDTHPALAIPELMRILVDEKELPWEDAWDITRATFAYTNHTLSAEALEQWPVSLMGHLLPRHLQIIVEIDRRLKPQMPPARPEDDAAAERTSLIGGAERRQVRMVSLAVVGSHSVNGVSPIHSRLLQQSLLADFHRRWPEKFGNKTNGISPRRWLLHANPALAELVSSAIGEGWITDLDQLRLLERHAEDAGFCQAFREVKRANKRALADWMREQLRVTVDPESTFDVQVKRIHAYKRQLLNLLHIVDAYLAVVEDGLIPAAPRTWILAGKAAPGYRLAKQIIQLIHEVARAVNRDPRASEWMRVLFVPDYRVSLAEKIIPAADLSEQISTAGTEASGTGNMKMALNGAVMVGTQDGTNLDIRDAVGAENLFLFGLTAAEVSQLRATQGYHPWQICSENRQVQRVVEAFRSGRLSSGNADLHLWVEQLLLNEADEHVHLADLPGYLEAHRQAGQAFCDRERWTRMSLMNVARIGTFSSDRSIREYARDIWEIHACG
ncbi:MAG: glycogen/starch/alpha-glucan phosphorylase [Acidobacteriota bacterium]